MSREDATRDQTSVGTPAGARTIEPATLKALVAAVDRRLAESNGVEPAEAEALRARRSDLVHCLVDPFNADPAAVEEQLHVVDARLAAQPDRLDLRIERMHLLRAAGCLDEALATACGILADEPTNAVALRIQKVLDGGSMEAADRTGASPFVRIVDAFDPSSHVRLWRNIEDFAKGDGGTRRAAGVYSGGIAEPTVDPDVRRAWTFCIQQTERAWFIDALMTLIDGADAWQRLGIPRFDPCKVEVQATQYPADGVFRIHRDNGAPNTLRRLTFVYYLHRRPRIFRGGDLILYDEPPSGRIADLRTYTRIDPTDNSLLLFPADRLHGVTPVAGGFDDAIDGRWTLNGWLHQAESR